MARLYAARRPCDRESTLSLAVTTIFVISLGLEVAGAAFLAAELLTLGPEALDAGNTYVQSGEPHLEAQIGPTGLTHSPACERVVHIRSHIT
jgi:hypothetical protein